MNDRIQQLAEQAGLDYMADHDLERFAELIVQECAEQVRPYSDDGSDTYLALFQAHKRIKKHFGVER